MKKQNSKMIKCKKTMKDKKEDKKMVKDKKEDKKMVKDKIMVKDKKEDKKMVKDKIMMKDKKQKDKISSKTTKLQKENFLRMDLIERIIRIEQRVSAKFKKKVNYNKTEYYKSLTPIQKERFEKHLKNKGHKKMFFKLLFLFPILIIGVLHIEYTGNIITDYLSPVSVGFLEFFMILFMFTMVVVFFIIFILGKIGNHLNKHFRFLENIFLGKNR